MTIKIIRLRLKHDPSNPKEFKLGLGPCGRTVIRLDANVTPHGVFIEQLCEDARNPNEKGMKAFADHTIMLNRIGIVNTAPFPSAFIDTPDTFFFPMEQVLECRIYHTDQPEVCTIKEPNE